MNITGLYDYQIEPVGLLLDSLRRNGAALDASEMGVGKTAHACAVIRELDLPTLALVPPISIPGWAELGKILNVPEFDIQSADLVRLGTTPFGWWDNPPPKVRPTWLRCENCQCEIDPKSPFSCPHHYKGLHCVHVKKREHHYGRFNWHPGIGLLVIDEVHRYAGLDSLNADMVIAAKRQGIPTLGLSGTVAESPLNLRALGFLLGLHKLMDFYPWAMKRGCYKLPMGGFEFCVAEEKKKVLMAELHQELFPSRGCRVRIADLGDKFPECQINAELVDFGDAAKMQRLYTEMAPEIAVVLRGAELGEVSANRAISNYQVIELLKVPELVELTKETVAQGRHVALFVVFRATVEALCKRLGTTCKVDGSQTTDAQRAERAENVRRFEANEEPVIVCTGAAGGFSIGLRDLTGTHPHSGFVLPGFSAREIRQIFGRLPRQGAKSKSIYRVFFAAGTDEEGKYKALRSKLNCLDALNDGDLNVQNLPLTEFPGCGRLV